MSGRLAYQVTRWPGKTWSQRRPDGNEGWVNNLAGVEHLPYRLPELVAADPDEPVWIPEGEKDVETLRGLGFVATCNSEGAGKWRPELTRHFAGRRVIVLADNDEPGRAHAHKVAGALLGTATEVQLIEELPGVPPKGDVSDLVTAAGDKAASMLGGLAGSTPSYRDEGVAGRKIAPAPDRKPAGRPDLVVVVDQPEEADPAPRRDGFHLTDMGNAERFVALHRGMVRYCHPWGTWLVWDGRRWARDRMDRVTLLAKEAVRGIYAEASRADDVADRKALADHAKRSEADARVRAMLHLAQSEPGIPALPEQLDAWPYLLNCSNGTLDLATGELRPHDPADLLTKLAPVGYDPAARSDVFDRFLGDAFGDDADLRAFVQRAAGYSLVGDTSEEVLFLIHGGTATGKSTFLEALKAALGDYALTMPFDALLPRRDVGGATPELARLQGARFVCSIEVDEGKRLAEALLKHMTGSDTITARFLHSNPFEFPPQHALWLACNDAPLLRDDDDAIWRRILRVPFEHSVPKERRDPDVKAALRDSERGGPAVLAWAVQGCLDWRADGLAVPAAVRASTDAYRAEMDPLRDFIEDRCSLGPDRWATAEELRGAYEAWAERNGAGRPVGTKRFGASLRTHGAEPEIRSGQRGRRCWRGIGLLAGHS